jgi:hypothetical protein
MEKNALIHAWALFGLACLVSSTQAQEIQTSTYGVAYQQQFQQTDSTTTTQSPWDFEAYLNDFPSGVTANVSTPGGTGGAIPTLTYTDPVQILGSYSSLSNLEAAYNQGNYVFSSNQNGTTSTLPLNTTTGFSAQTTVSNSDTSSWSGGLLTINSGTGTLHFSFTTPNQVEYAIFTLTGTTGSTLGSFQQETFGSLGSNLASGTTENFTLTGVADGQYEGSLSLFTDGTGEENGTAYDTSAFGGSSDPVGTTALQTTTNLNIKVDPAAAPEPSTIVLFLAGFAGMVALTRRSKARLAPNCS